MNKRNEELITSKFLMTRDGGKHFINVCVDKKTGCISRRKGYNTFGEMVDVLWNINKDAKKMGWTGEFTITLPLKGVKPIYKKTFNLQSLKEKK